MVCDDYISKIFRNLVVWSDATPSFLKWQLVYHYIHEMNTTQQNGSFVHVLCSVIHVSDLFLFVFELLL